MLGERSDQMGLWEADRLYLDHVGKDTFYGLLASLRGRLFRDADFAGFYCADNGRDSVPPSLLATALLLQSHDKVSDAEAKTRADFDIRWKVALGIEVEDRPFAKSTLQVFRAQLILHGKVREVFESSLRLARESGYLKRRSMKVALDTTNILGRGAVKDTYNLLADGIVKLLPEDKNLDLQVERLVRAGCSLGNIRAEEASGARNDRGGLLELLDLALVREYLEPTEVYEKRPPRGRRSEPVRERAPEPVRMALYAVQRGVCPGCGIFPPHFLRFEVDHIVALADNVATGVMLDERQAVLTGRRLAQYHRERPEQ